MPASERALAYRSSLRAITEGPHPEPYRSPFVSFRCRSCHSTEGPKRSLVWYPFTEGLPNRVISRSSVASTLPISHDNRSEAPRRDPWHPSRSRYLLAPRYSVRYSTFPALLAPPVPNGLALHSNSRGTPTKRKALRNTRAIVRYSIRYSCLVTTSSSSRHTSPKLSCGPISPIPTPVLALLVVTEGPKLKGIGPPALPKDPKPGTHIWQSDPYVCPLARVPKRMTAHRIWLGIHIRGPASPWRGLPGYPDTLFGVSIGSTGNRLRAGPGLPMGSQG